MNWMAKQRRCEGNKGSCRCRWRLACCLVSARVMRGRGRPTHHSLAHPIIEVHGPPAGSRGWPACSAWTVLACAGAASSWDGLGTRADNTLVDRYYVWVGRERCRDAPHPLVAEAERCRSAGSTYSLLSYHNGGMSQTLCDSLSRSQFASSQHLPDDDHRAGWKILHSRRPVPLPHTLRHRTTARVASQRSGLALSRRPRYRLLPLEGTSQLGKSTCRQPSVHMHG